VYVWRTYKCRKVVAVKSAIILDVTMSHKKQATLLWTITPISLGFLHFLYQWKQQWVLYRVITKFTTFYPNCVSTLRDETKTAQYSSFWSQLSQYFITSTARMSLWVMWAVFLTSFQFLVGNCFSSLLVENLLHSHRFWSKFISKTTFFIWTSLNFHNFPALLFYFATCCGQISCIFIWSPWLAFYWLQNSWP